jgi:hypothetical protein
VERVGYAAVIAVVIAVYGLFIYTAGIPPHDWVNIIWYFVLIPPGIVLTAGVLKQQYIDPPPEPSPPVITTSSLYGTPADSCASRGRRGRPSARLGVPPSSPACRRSARAGMPCQLDREPRDHGRHHYQHDGQPDKPLRRPIR